MCKSLVLASFVACSKFHPKTDKIKQLSDIMITIAHFDSA